MSSVIKFNSPSDLIKYVEDHADITAMMFQIDGTVGSLEPIDNQSRLKVRQIFNSTLFKMGRTQNEQFTFKVWVLQDQTEIGFGIWSILKQKMRRLSN